MNPLILARGRRKQVGGGGIGGNDEYTVLLIQSNTTHGSTVIVDSSTGGAGSPHTITRSGVIHSTVNPKFGTSSLYYTDDLLYTNMAADIAFGTGDFTYDTWFYHTASGVIDYLFDATLLKVFLDNGTLRCLSTYGAGTGGALYAGTSYSLNTWYHVAIVRASGVMTMYLDGVNVASEAETYNYYNKDLYIGRYYPNNNNNFTGYLDEFRISKGIARWTGNFSVPTESYS